MTILDSQGRLFGKVSILDIGAALVILLAIFGILFVPGTGGSIAQVGGAKTETIQVDVMVRGLGVLEPENLVNSGDKASFVIRNQPAGGVDVQAVEFLPRSVAVPQPDGSVIAAPDPRPELDYTTDLLISLEGQAQVTDDGPVFGNSKVKIGTLVQLQGPTYDFNATVVNIQFKDRENS